VHQAHLRVGDVGAIVEAVVAAAAGGEQGGEQREREQMAFFHFHDESFLQVRRICSDSREQTRPRP